MTDNLPLQARMLRLYQRFKQSNLTRAAFCRFERICIHLAASTVSESLQLCVDY
ncbi:hypothetical protein QNI22_22745 [Cytophagaceae bacterium BD1B2-1]|uniref:Uncharacterized protein n=1 Tax=Xanthocytophaga agilis TaxID=3048010 RepID=A0AAE3UF58_9BACT|nr:hypothetical protein [Xanthocytophaga agilis]